MDFSKITQTNPYSFSEQELLNPLPYDVYFVCRNPDWKDLVESSVLPSIEPLLERCLRSKACDIWSVQTYICLKQRGLNVHLVSKYIPGKICVVPYDYLLARHLPFRSYIVAVRYDIARPELCEQQIVLNKLSILKPTDHFVPHWPQPNLRPRNLTRGTNVENLVHKGQPGALADPFKTHDFLNQLKGIDIKFSPSVGDPNTMYDEWRDYTEADVVLAIRNNTEYDLTLKPPLKLINAWFAGCPALLGPEPAYQALRRSELDYIEVRNRDDVILSLKRLKNNPDLYAAMVENGFRRAQEFTANHTAKTWQSILEIPVAAGYETWCRQSQIFKLVGRPIQFMHRVNKHKQAHKDYRFRIINGSRLFSDAHFPY